MISIVMVGQKKNSLTSYAAGSSVCTELSNRYEILPKTDILADSNSKICQVKNNPKSFQTIIN